MLGTVPLAMLVLVASASVAMDARADAPADARAAPRDDASVMGVPLAPADGGPRRWRAVAGGALDVRDAPSADAALVERLGDGAVLANLGCEAVDDGRVWCRVGNLRGRERGHAPAEALRPAIGPDGRVPRGVDDSVRRVGKGDVDARGRIRCAQERGQAMMDCKATVARGVGGDAAVLARFPNGFGRTLRFVHGEFVGADATMSGSGADIDWRRDGELHVLRVDDQRYELPDAFVFGP